MCLERPVVGGPESVLSQEGVEGCHLDGGVERRVVVKLKNWQKFFPVGCVLHVQPSKKVEDGPVEPLDLGVGLGVVGRGGGVFAVV